MKAKAWQDPVKGYWFLEEPKSGVGKAPARFFRYPRTILGKNDTELTNIPED